MTGKCATYAIFLLNRTCGERDEVPSPAALCVVSVQHSPSEKEIGSQTVTFWERGLVILLWNLRTLPMRLV